VSTATHGRRAPTDARVAQLRGVLEALLESLDATVRIARWKEEESAPEPLERSATKLVERLASANRVANGKLVGAPAFVATSSAIVQAIQRLDAALVAYRRNIDTAPAEREEAAMVLDAEIGRVKLDAGRWE
jgi:hypothetical protein